ncbi:MAG: hypothetical protein ACD_7C00540G0004, partial [uncultured bacterium]
MKYQLLGNRLRACQSIASNHKTLLSGCNILLLQHLFEDTLEFTNHLLNNGAKFNKILGKDYSTDQRIFAELKKKKLPVEIINSHFEETNSDYLRNILITALNSTKKEGRKLIIQEIGGYFSRIINSIPTDLTTTLAGVVEDTTYGYNKYKAVEAELKYPVFHVARSQLKEIEAVFVGEAIVLAFNNIMRDIGISIQGRKALVIGYGMIGKNIARFLKLNNL